MKISVIIPVYKKTEMFLRNLKHNYEFIKDYEIIVVDDASGECLEETLSKMLPNVMCITNNRNLGFAKTVNIGARKATGDFLMFLNSDVRIRKKFPGTMLDTFKNRDVFSVSFAQIERDGSIAGKNSIRFEKGLFHHSKASDQKKGINAWAIGGSCIIRKKYFDKLGRFSDLYSPFYWEDTDLSYRAYKQGWKVIFDPKIIVKHQTSSTINKFYSPQRIKSIAYRNQLIFTWINASDIPLIVNHLVNLPKIKVSMLINREISFFIGLIHACLLLPQIIIYRTKHKGSKRSDAEILSIFSS